MWVNGEPLRNGSPEAAVTCTNEMYTESDENREILEAPFRKITCPQRGNPFQVYG